MQQWKHKPLGKLGKIVSGSTPRTTEKEYWGGDIPWITPADLTNHEGVFFKGKFRKITKAGYESCSTTMLPAGSILFSSRAPIGHCAVTTHPLCTNQGFKSIIPNADELDPIYGFFALKFFTPQIVNQGRGATFSEVNKEIMENFCIPAPPIEEQQRIAGILARADRLWQLRRYALQLSEGYLQSVFLQMFGDPVTNPMGWEIRPLGKLLTTIDSGVSPVCQERPALDKEWGILKLGAVTTCNYLETENKAITYKTSPRMELEVKSGDLLFSRKNTYDLVGACAYVHHTRPKLMLPDLIFRLQIEDKKELDPIYLWQLLIFPTKRKMVQRLAGGSAGSMPNISKGRLNTVEIPLPSPELQSKFACVVRQAERLRAQQQEAARQADHLFATLLHRAFRGEL